MSSSTLLSSTCEPKEGNASFVLLCQLLLQCSYMCYISVHINPIWLPYEIYKYHISSISTLYGWYEIYKYHISLLRVLIVLSISLSWADIGKKLFFVFVFLFFVLPLVRHRGPKHASCTLPFLWMTCHSRQKSTFVTPAWRSGVY